MKTWLKGGLIGAGIGVFLVLLIRFLGLNIFLAYYLRDYYYALQIPPSYEVVNGATAIFVSPLAQMPIYLIIILIVAIIGAILGRIIGNPDTPAISKGWKIGLLCGLVVGILLFLHWFGFEKDPGWRWKFSSLVPGEIVFSIVPLIGVIILGALIGWIIQKIKSQ